MKDPFEDDLDRARHDRIRAGLAIQLVAMATGASPAAIASPRRVGTHVCRARYLAIYLCHVALGWPLQRVASAFGRDRSTAGIACRWTEDARDDPALDALLEHLETCLRAAGDTPSVELAA